MVFLINGPHGVLLQQQDFSIKEKKVSQPSRMHGGQHIEYQRQTFVP